MSLFKLGSIIAGGLLLALVGCDNLQPKFEKTTKNIELTIITYKNVKEAAEALDGRRGMAVWSPNDNKCTVHFVAGDMYTAGHELHHCIYGSFHLETKIEK